MRTVHALDPDGVLWHVRVVWLPRNAPLSRRYGGWRKRKDGKENRLGDAADGVDLLSFLDDPISAIAVAVGWLVGVILFWWLALPLLLVLLDVLLLLPLLLLGALLKVLLRRPWRVEAVRPAPGRGGSRHPMRDEVAVVGWRRALRARDGIADGLRTSGASAWPGLAARQWD